MNAISSSDWLPEPGPFWTLAIHGVLRITIVVDQFTRRGGVFRVARDVFRDRQVAENAQGFQPALRPPEWVTVEILRPVNAPARRLAVVIDQQ